MRWLVFLICLVLFSTIFYSLGKGLFRDSPKNFEEPELKVLFEAQNWQRLTEILSSRLQLRPLSPQEKFYQGRVQLELGQPSEALRSAEAALSQGYKTSHARQLKAECLLKLKNFDQAESWIRYWRKQDPSNPEVPYYLGLSLILRPDTAETLDLSRYQEGISMLHRALKEGTVQQLKAQQLLADSYMFLGIQARDESQMSDALYYMNTAVQLDPENGSFHYALGRLHLALKRWTEALDSLDLAHTFGIREDQEMTSLLDDLYMVHHKLAAVALIEKRFDQAIEHTQQGRKWVTTKVAEQRLSQLEQTARQQLVQTLRQRAKRVGADQRENLWQDILLWDPQDPEALWETRHQYPEALRLQVEKQVLQSDWGGEARHRLAESAWLEGDFLKSVDLLMEAWLITQGQRRLQFEEILFQRLKEISSPPRHRKWKVVWNWLQEDPDSPHWAKLSQEVEKYLKERYYVWIHLADIHLKRREIEKTQFFLNEIESLDPPEHVRPRLMDLQRSLEALSR